MSATMVNGNIIDMVFKKTVVMQFASDLLLYINRGQQKIGGQQRRRKGRAEQK